jgi:hypothetical protein
MLQGHIIIMLKAYEFRALAYCLLKCRAIKLTIQCYQVKYKRNISLWVFILHAQKAYNFLFICANFVT